MHIKVDRFKSDSDTTLSKVFVDDEFVCYGLEDAYHPTKIPGKTRIPAGHYKIALRNAGRFHDAYQARWPDMHCGVLHVLDVPNYQWILIHTGNTSENTEGCLLVGEQADETDGAMRVNASRTAYCKLYPMVVEAAKVNELDITYLSNDGAENESSNKGDTMPTLEDNFQVTSEMSVNAATTIQRFLRALDRRQIKVRLYQPDAGGSSVQLEVIDDANNLIQEYCNAYNVTLNGHTLTALS